MARSATAPQLRQREAAVVPGLQGHKSVRFGGTSAGVQESHVFWGCTTLRLRRRLQPESYLHARCGRAPSTEASQAPRSWSQVWSQMGRGGASSTLSKGGAVTVGTADSRRHVVRRCDDHMTATLEGHVLMGQQVVLLGPKSALNLPGGGGGGGPAGRGADMLGLLVRGRWAGHRPHTGTVLC